MIIRIKELLLLFSLLLIGCSSHAPRTPAPVLKTALSDPIMVIAQLKEQLNQWRGTPYHYGGMDRRG